MYRMLCDSDAFDYSAVCLLITKAVDNELHKYLYTNLKNLNNDKKRYPSFLKNKNGGNFKNEDFTLGSVKYFCCQQECYTHWDKIKNAKFLTRKAMKTICPL